MVSFTSTINQVYEIEITQDHLWQVRKDNNIYSVIKSDDYYYLLPLIELEREQVLNKLNSEYNSNKSKLVVKPIEFYIGLIKYCLKTNTHWGEIASLKLIDEDYDDQIKEILTKIIDDKKYDQKSRHYLYGILKRNER